MATQPLRLDHITVTAQTLPEGIEYVADQIGIRVPLGGQHPIMGTHNALMALGPNEFLEIIAIDPDAAPIARARWFGLDIFSGPPRLSTWVLATDQIDESLRELPDESGPAIPMTRGQLSWLISVPESGQLPFQGACPTVIQWPGGPHPSAQMTNLGCRLTALDVNTPKAQTLNDCLSPAMQDPRIRIHESHHTGLTAEIATPSGLKTLV